MDKRPILEELERELRARLRVDLPAVAEGRDSLYFFNSDHNPMDLPRWRLSKRGEEAFRLASQIRDLRAELGESTDCEASLLLEAIERHADRDNHHRPGPKRLAATLAEAVEKLGTVGRGKQWFGAKTVFRHPTLEREPGLRCYEERVVLVRASDPDEAIALAEEEARRYAAPDGKVLKFTNLFQITDPIEPGAEVFSIMRSVALEEDEFVTRFYDDGSFHTR